MPANTGNSVQKTQVNRIDDVTYVLAKWKVEKETFSLTIDKINLLKHLDLVSARGNILQFKYSVDRALTDDEQRMVTRIEQSIAPGETE